MKRAPGFPEADARWQALAERSLAARADEPAWLAALRRHALEAFAAQGLPHTRLEEWRYTNLTRFAKLDFEAAPEPAALPSRQQIEQHAAPVFACGLYVFVDGRFAPDLSTLASEAGVHVESLREVWRREPDALRGRLGALLDPKLQPLAALASALFEDGALLRLPSGAQLADPLHLVFVATRGDARRACAPRVLIDAGAGSRASLIVDYVTLGDAPGLSNAVTEVHLAAGSRIDLIALQRESDASFHFSATAAVLGRDARFGHHALALGGGLVRNDLEVRLAAEGAEAVLNGLFVGAGDEVVDNHSLVDHAAPHGTSRQLYKGILGGRSRGVFRGRVRVCPGAQQTSAEQSNPNLLLGTRASIDTKPQLEILTDDVQCSHGASIGQLDEEALFYLRSRGISEKRARRALTHGFAQQVLAALPVPALAEQLHETLGARLAAAHAETLA